MTPVELCEGKLSCSRFCPQNTAIVPGAARGLAHVPRHPQLSVLLWARTIWWWLRPFPWSQTYEKRSLQAGS